MNPADVVAGIAAAASTVSGMLVPFSSAVMKQIHAGCKVEARVTFDLPGPFDPVVNVVVEARLDDGQFRIKQFHLTPAT